MRKLRLGIAFILVHAALACRAPQPRGPVAAPAPASIAPSAAEIVQRQVDAYNAHDLEAFVATYTDDVVITVASSGQVVVQGKAALREVFGGLFRGSPTVNARVAEQRTEGDSVVLLHEIITGAGGDKPDPWDFGWVRYEVQGGRIKAVRFP
jgi:putative hydrolase of HD superfamily